MSAALKLHTEKNPILWKVIRNSGNNNFEELDYYPFGAVLPGRSSGGSDYRFGFQGQEKDDEMKGEGNSINFAFRMHDPRLGRFFSIDPLAGSYPYNSPYAFSENIVINSFELEGLERYYSPEGKNLGKITPIMEGVSEDDIRVISEEDWNRIHNEQGGKSFSTVINGKSVNITLSYFLYQNSADFTSSRASAGKILKNIFNSNIGALNGTRISYSGSDGYAEYSDQNNQITINDNNSWNNDYYALLNMLVKESTHITDQYLDKQNRHVRELNGYINALSHSSFKKADSGYQRKFLKGAGKFIYDFKFQAMESEYYGREEDASYFNSMFNSYVKQFENLGVKFDFSVLDENYKNYAEGGRTLSHDPNMNYVEYEIK